MVDQNVKLHHKSGEEIQIIEPSFQEPTLNSPSSVVVETYRLRGKGMEESHSRENKFLYHVFDTGPSGVHIQAQCHCRLLLLLFQPDHKKPDSFSTVKFNKDYL